MNTLIVSITSYPKRFKYLPEVLESLSQQTYRDFHILLTLCKTECENDLEELNKILECSELPVEINWVEKNTYCHKNTFEAMLKYPDNPILVIDDDIIRMPRCIENFVKDYLEHDCIIARTFDYVNDANKIKNSGGGILRKHTSNREWSFTGVEMPNTGGHGILYPPSCFKDPRFYDSDLILKCSPTSNEVWLYYWLCKESKTVFFKWDKTWSMRLDGFSPNGQLFLINTTKKRNEYFENCKKTLGDIP